MMITIVCQIYFNLKLFLPTERNFREINKLVMVSPKITIYFSVKSKVKINIAGI